MFRKAKNMRKRILAVAMVAAMATTMFAGCGRKTEKADTSNVDKEKMKSEFTTNQKVNTKDKITLTVWESTAGPDAFIKAAGELFHEIYPNITVKYVNVESTDANSKIVLDGPAGNGPDLFATAHNNLGIMASGNHILEVPEEEKEIVKNNCTPEAYLGATLNKADGTQILYGYPVSTETYALFYNRALIKDEEVPKTMEELVAYMKEFKKSHESTVYPFLMDAGNAYYSVMFTSSATNHLYGPNGNDVKNTYMNTEEAVNQLKDFQAISAEVGLKAKDIDYNFNDTQFAAGKLAMDICGAWKIKAYEEANIDFGITSIPSLTGTDTPPASFMGVRCMFVSKYSKHPAEAIAFAEFLMTPQIQALRCEATCTIPARNDVLDIVKSHNTDGKYDKLLEYMEGLQKQIDYAYPMPNMSQSSLFWTPFGTAYANIWNNPSIDIKKELDDANNTATKK